MMFLALKHKKTKNRQKYSFFRFLVPYFFVDQQFFESLHKHLRAHKPKDVTTQKDLFHKPIRLQQWLL